MSEKVPVLFVGTPFTRNSMYCSKVPAVASRSLDPNRMLKITVEAAYGFFEPTIIFVNKLLRQSYLINYACSTSKGNVTVRFDQGIRFYNQGLYKYTADPIIEYLESGVNCLNKVHKGIPADGIKI